MESYDYKIDRIVNQIQRMPWEQPRQRRVTVGMRIKELLKKEFPEEPANIQQQVQADSPDGPTA
jgi:hypothetical protein